MTGLGFETCVRDALRLLLPPGSSVVIATSGGPDSQALLDLIGRLRGALELAAVRAVGVDHRLRPEANAELDFAEALARAHSIGFERRSVHVSQCGNIMANAREVRYRALRAAADELGDARIAVAHTATDQAETMLLNLARGCGAKGLGGMPFRRGRVIRPMLGVRRQEVFAYLAHQGISYALDPSNTNMSRSRARLRAQVLPVLESVNATAVLRMAQAAALVRADDRDLRARARRLLEKCRGEGASLRVAPLGNAPRPVRSRVMLAWLREQAIAVKQDQLEQLLKPASRRAVRVSGGRWLRLDQGCWRVFEPEGEPYDVALEVGATCSVPGSEAFIISHVEPLRDMTHWRKGAESKQVAFDADQVHFPIYVRSARLGDRVRPFGLAGTAKVSDVFTNAKIPHPLRAGWPLVTVGDEVAWVVGLRRGAMAPITEATRRVLVIELNGALPWSAC